MQQYYRFKERHPGCVLLFRVGDFYEMFDDDAVTVSKAIGLTLTQRTAGVPMAGVPFHQLETYLRKLVAHGFRVAVCEQVEEASKAKGIVKRAVTRVITPGTLVDDSLLESDTPSTLAALHQEGETLGLAVVDLSVGTFTVLVTTRAGLADELARRHVREVIVSQELTGLTPPPLVSPTPRPAWHFRVSDAVKLLCEHFGVATLSGFGLDPLAAYVPAAGAVLRYIQETQAAREDEARSGAAKLAHLSPPRLETDAAACVVDAVSLRSLEILQTIRPGGGAQDRSLLSVFSQTGRGGCRTAPGKRLLREWLCRPLRDLAALHERHEAVAAFLGDDALAKNLGAPLGEIQDLSRIAGRVALERATPRDVVALGRSIRELGVAARAIGSCAPLRGHHRALAAAAGELAPLGEEIAGLCVDEPPAHMREGGLFRGGVDAELDEARGLERDASAWLAAYQDELREEHDLPGLKVGYNRVFGYYIELPAGQAARAPEALIRTQTLKGAQRYTTPRLREFEGKVLTARARSLERERVLLGELLEKIRRRTRAITDAAGAIAALDVLLAFAQRARAMNWTRPTLTGGRELMIRQGRHPVLEEVLGADFVPNTLCLNGAEARPGKEGKTTPARRGEAPLLWQGQPGGDEHPELSAGHLALITGPNMAGKSTFIRQVALIALLAHAGSFVPAEAATIGLIDRLFTRIGADDALHEGRSTFMVEMSETANILRNATDQSLVILDEIGRGTGTLDGLCLARAIAEFLASEVPARTLFATHYHELTALEQEMPGRVLNLHVTVREWADPKTGEHEIVFLHHIMRGASDRSYGVHVARLAGLPAGVIRRARELMASPGAGPAPAAPTSPHAPAHNGLLESLRQVEIETLSPLQAFDALRRLTQLASQNGAAQER